MKITCPDCGFFRELSSDRAPSRPVVDTCPKCGCRFRFLPDDASSHLLEHGTPAEPVDFRSEKVILPPGAIVPGEQTDAPRPNDSRQNGPQRDNPQPEAARPAPEADASARRHEQEPDAPQDGPRPRNRKARRHDRAEADANPWDLAPAPAGYMSAFYQTTLRVMFGGERFFTRLHADAPQWRALAYYLVVVLVLVASQYLWVSMSREVLEQSFPAGTPFGDILRLMFHQPMLYILLLVASTVLQLYTVSAVLLMGFRLSGIRHATFYIIFQVVAYSAAPVLLCLIPILGLQVGLIWSVACIVTGCRLALGLDWARTLLGFLPAGLFFFLLLMFMRP